MTNQILITSITAEQLTNAVVEGLICRLDQLTKKSSSEEEQFLTREETAKLLSVSLVTLNDWSKKGILNRYRIGNRVYYKRKEIDNSLIPTDTNINPTKNHNRDV